MSETEPWSFKLKLRKPVQAYGKEVAEITLRQPTGMDYLTYGNPIIVDMASAGDQIVWDTRKVVPLLAALAQVPNSAITDLDVQDLVLLQWAIGGFFIPSLTADQAAAQRS